ncbi:aminoglycoside phosphotransferase family protein [Streptomyces sp. bgisy126]|uniref:aminoglycoside phosphotransferase family protein n=1 Tax=unclassified Streptomyces TaxID=2593676 RepID=UPI003EB6A3D6
MTPTQPPAIQPPSAPPAPIDGLAALARAAAHPPGAARCGCADGGLVRVLADREDGTVVRHGALVVKAHAPDTDPEAHRARIALAARPDVAGVLLSPLPLPPAAPDVLGGRPVTVWPYGPPVDPADPDAAPWEEAARLLALLHRTPLPPGTVEGLPAMRAPLKAALAVDRMRRAAPDHPAAATVLAAWATVPTEPTVPANTPRLLCHGDFHLGQLVRLVPPSHAPAPTPEAPSSWRLIDVDDLGTGDPAWDLARPAAWFAAGILPPEVWSRFLGAYQEAGGPAVGSDPWVRLDVPARALTVQTAALALAKSSAERRPLDEVEEVMIDTCARIAGHRTG